GTPEPVSETLIFTELGWADGLRRRSCGCGRLLEFLRSHMYGSACNQTVPPDGVNFYAFTSRLEITRSSLGASKENSITFSLARKYRARPLSWNRGDHRRQTSDRHALTFPASNFILSSPVSSTLKLRKS